jgi:diguanylate cyclase (GGDEF)-like protein
MARAAACLFAVGAAMTLPMVALPVTEGADRIGMIATAACACLLAAGIALASSRIPRAAFPWIIACGTALITAAIHFRGGPAGAQALHYIWVVVYSSYFFSIRAATLQLLLALGGYGLVVAASDAPGSGLEAWLTAAVALLATACLLSMLMDRMSRLVARLTSAARTDSLTGLLNRRGFEELFELELERARRGGTPLSVVAGDLDHFKAVNDRFGHHVGDIALERASATLDDTKRRVDTLARLGGEEFALIVPGTDERRALMLAERLRSAIKEAFALDPVRITMSFGIACFPRDGRTPEQLMRAADRALYAAKELGRDRTVIYSAEVSKGLDAYGRGARDEQLGTVLALAETLDIRESGAAGHSHHVGRYASMTARAMGLPPWLVERIAIAGVLHDVGKIGVSDRVLTKPTSLSRGEWEEIKRHPVIGARILRNARMDDIGAWVLSHHERPDGRGFPTGLVAEDIPLEARILAVADAYEAMTSDRPYRDALTDDQARAELVRGSDTQFDARVVSAFLDALEREDVASAS